MDCKFKMVLLGDTDVGKTCVLTRWTHNTFSKDTSPTIGVDFIVHRLVKNDKSIRLQIWDASGQERFRSLLSSYIKNVRGAMIVFDVTNRESFEGVQRWSQAIDEHTTSKVSKLLVGNKCDITSTRVVDHTQAKSLADSLDMSYVETSASDSSNIEQAFSAIVDQMVSTALMEPTESPKVAPTLTIEPRESVAATTSVDISATKMVLVGDSGVGKSSLLIRFIDDTFHNTYIPTIGVDFRSLRMKHDGTDIRFHIWDTAGQERFHNLISPYFRNAAGAIIVFDVTNENVERWLREVREHGEDDVKSLLVGNKCDLTLERAVDQAQAQTLADSLHIPYLETSAKCTINVQQAFLSLVSEMIPSKADTGKTIKLNSQKTSQKNKSGVC